MKPNDIITHLHRPENEQGDEFMAWAKEVVKAMIPAWEAKPFEEPYNSQMASIMPVLNKKRLDLGSQIRVKSLALWITDPASSAADHLPPFTVFMNHPEGHSLEVDTDAARQSDLVFCRDEQSNEPIPLGFQYYMNTSTLKLYVRDGYAWKPYS